VAATPGRDFGGRSYRRPVVGALAIVAMGAIVALAIALFSGSLAETDSVTVMTDRAGLLMDRGAKVKLNGAQIGTVSAVSATSDGRAELKLAIDRTRMSIVPSNALVEIGANTVFGAKSVEFLRPTEPSAVPLRAGQVLDSEHVTVEVNTIFVDLNSVLTSIDPPKLNQTLGAISTALGGRGEKFGQSLSDFNAFLAELEPGLPRLDRELQIFPDVATAFADAAPDLMSIFRNATRISQTLVETQSDLDRFLVSSIGLAETGNDVIGANREPLTNLMRVLVPTTDLTNEYHEALNCTLTGMISFATKPPNPLPGVVDLAALSLGQERYRYPQDLPKVAATGGPQCKGQLPIQYNNFPPKIVADVGADPSRYGNQGILLNSDALKQWLFGPIDGPPRNTLQWGQPG
jgi:phospholipid/cholesterol/gamma-HCH transport system substrate-binding protein